MTKKHYPASALRGVLQEIAEGQKTGNLQINFSQGAVSGSINWNERERLDLTKARDVPFNESTRKANCSS